MKIAVAGTGYVGLSMAVLLAQNNSVTAVDIVPQKVEMINNKKDLANVAVFEGEKIITELSDEEIYKIFSLGA